jgi:hypothetical protein
MAGEGDANAQSGASMSKLPKRVAGQAPDMVAQAKLLANSPKMVRHIVVTSLIAQSRSFWRGTDQEILAAAGYRDADEYWHVATSEPMEALSFAHLLAVHLIDPTEHTNEFDRRSLVRIRIDSSLRFALKTGESWFIKDSLPSEGGGIRDLEALMLHPRAAAKWLLSLPKRRDLVPPGLKAFLERTELLREREVPALGLVERERLLAQSPAQMAGLFRDDLATAGQADVVPQPAPITPGAPAGTGTARRSRKGPAPGTVDRFGESDRALFPEIERIMREGRKSVHAAALEVASAGKVQGGGTPESRAKRLAKGFRKERPRTTTR